jgi:aspartate dehydrogenase
VGSGETMSRLRLVLLGYGAINQKVAHILQEQNAPVDIVAIAMREARSVKALLPEGACVIHDPQELALIGADMVLEAAGREAVKTWGEAALTHANCFVVASTSAFVDTVFYQNLCAIAHKNKHQLLIPAGALAGVDALSAASLMGLESVSHMIIKPAKAWMGSKAETLCDLANLSQAHAFFEGQAGEAANAFPQNANVAVISSLAGIGLEKTFVRLIADPKATANAHIIEAKGAFGKMRLEIENLPFPENPKTSMLTALSLVRLVNNRIGSVVI